MGTVLIQQMMEVDKQNPQILDFLRVLTGIDGENTEKLKEVEEEGFGKSFEDECAVGMLC